MEQRDEQTLIFEQRRGRLFGLAYRMLGRAQDAEDAVQDAYLRWAAADPTKINNPTAWLDKVLTNLCLNRLSSAAARHEYVGPWLPEPMLTGTDPADEVERDQAVRYASLVLLERLAPVERAVFVLRSAFGYGHRELAELLELTEETSRQHYRRARQRIDGERRFEADPVRHRRLIDSLLRAAQQGDLDQLERVLAEDVVSQTDGGGVVSAARRPVLGRRRVARYLGLSSRRLTDAWEIRVVELNGLPGLIATVDGRLAGALQFDAADGLIHSLHLVVNPQKLRYLDRQLSQTVTKGPPVRFSPS